MKEDIYENGIIFLCFQDNQVQIEINYECELISHLSLVKCVIFLSVKCEPPNECTKIMQ